MPRKRKSTTPVKKQSTSTSDRTNNDGSRVTHRRKRKPLWQREIAYFMNSTHLLIPKLPFCRVCHSILSDMSRSEMRFQKAAIDCLQEAAEAYIVNFLSDSNLLALHAKRVTLMAQDIRLIKILRDI